MIWTPIFNPEPVFTDVSVSSLSANQAVMTDGDKKLVSADYLDQAVKTTSEPKFSKLRIGVDGGDDFETAFNKKAYFGGDVEAKTSRELEINGTFDDGLTGWIESGTWSTGTDSGDTYVAGPAGQDRDLTSDTAPAAVIGEKYLISVTYKNTAYFGPGRFNKVNYGGVTTSFDQTGTKTTQTFYVTATATGGLILRSENSAGNSTRFYNVSLKRVCNVSLGDISLGDVTATKLTLSKAQAAGVPDTYTLDVTGQAAGLSTAGSAKTGSAHRIIGGVGGDSAGSGIGGGPGGAIAITGGKGGSAGFPSGSGGAVSIAGGNGGDGGAQAGAGGTLTLKAGDAGTAGSLASATAASVSIAGGAARKHAAGAGVSGGNILLDGGAGDGSDDGNIVIGNSRGNLYIKDGKNIRLDTTTGTKIGTATTQKIGFFNATPVDQPDTVSDAATQDLTGTDTVDQTKLEADLTSCKNAINTLIDRLQELGLIA